MFRLLGYLKQCKKSVLAIIILLIVQAYCDLALPQYTSDLSLIHILIFLR